MIPAAYHAAKHVVSPEHGLVLAASSGQSFTDLDKDSQEGLLIISRGTAILLLGVYIAYLFFQLKTHASLFTPKRKPSMLEALPNESGREVVEEIVDTPNMSVVAAGLG